MLEKRLQRLDEQYRTYTVTCEDKMQKKKTSEEELVAHA
jgi:hypothetical protein